MNLFSRFTRPAAPETNAAEAQASLKGPDKPYILDVRQPEEFQSGHIPEAVLIPLNELGRRMDELPRDRPILCVCRSGNRSGTATRQLVSAGYQATNLVGGMIAWARAGLPVKQGSRR